MALTVSQVVYFIALESQVESHTILKEADPKSVVTLESHLIVIYWNLVLSNCDHTGEVLCLYTYFDTSPSLSSETVLKPDC